MPIGATPVVLLVEDEASLVSSLSYYLRKNGFTVILAGDGRAGLDAARTRDPDVVVLDIMLPEIDGLEVCRQIRTKSDVPILMLSAKGDETDRVIGLELGRTTTCRSHSASVS